MNTTSRVAKTILPKQAVLQPVIVLDGVCVDYPNHPHALRDVSLQLHRGERVALIGPSGAGKSTLLKAINGLLPLARGTRIITLRGLDGAASSGETTHPLVSMVFQEFALAQRLTVLTNVLIGSLGRLSGWRGLLGMFPNEEQQRALQYIDAVGLRGLEYRRVSQLSSGQKQRVALARALMQEHELLLADEPVASLDNRTSYGILDLLAALQEELRFTLIISLHDLDHVRRYCTRVIGIRRGRVVFDGPTLMLNDDALEIIFGGDDIANHHTCA
jgi:phosphonate transport system ATP-binding protein